MGGGFKQDKSSIKRTDRRWREKAADERKKDKTEGEKRCFIRKEERMRKKEEEEEECGN